MSWHLLVSVAFGASEEETSGLWKTEWIVAVACALHDAQSAFRWALSHAHATATIHSVLHKSLASYSLPPKATPTKRCHDMSIRERARNPHLSNV